MAIVQISKIQQRSGNLVDLPQLDEAELGWASDAKRLFIGKTVPNENVEVLTSYSNISFSQLTGAVGNLNVTAVTAENGQVLTYDGTNWVNRGATSGGLINLGDVANVKIDGGAISYVLETDGTGNLSWTPKSTIIAYIANITQANPAVVTTTTDNFFTNGALLTITDVSGMTQVNGNSYYADVLTSNTFALYSDSGLTTPVNSTGYGAYTANGRAVSTTSGSGSTSAGGGNTTVQFNNSNLLDGDTDLTWNYLTNILTVNGNANVGNLNTSGIVTSTRVISNISTGTAPFTVSSTTRVANLSVAYANVSDFDVVTSQSSGTYYPVFVNGTTTGNYALASNSNISANLTTGTITATRFVSTGNITAGNVYANSGTIGASLLTGTLTTAAQPNITSVGTLSSLGVSGTVTASTLVSNVTTGTAPFTVTSTTQVANLSVATAGTVTTAAQPNITSVGTLSSLSVTGNVTAGNVYANSGTIGASLLAGTLTTASQPNVTSVGTLSSLTVTGNVTAGNLIGIFANGTSNIRIPAVNGNVNISSAGNANVMVVTGSGANVTGTLAISGNVSPLGIKTDNYYYANGVSISFAGSYSNSNVASYLPTYTGTVGTGSATFRGTTLTAGANTTAGTITGNWTLSAGSLLQSTYADLAEMYVSDQPYEPGTVVEFGGEHEVTIASEGTFRVAGIVSTNPAYVMNSNCQGENVVAIALQGRVPCKVIGTVNKGDMMISAGNGYAKSYNTPLMGTVIGKAVQDSFATENIIEIVVGRL